MNVLDQIRALRDEGQPFVTATVVRVEKPTSAKPGAKAIITQDGRLSGWVGGSCAEPTVKREAAKVLLDGQPRLVRLCPPEKMGTWPQDGVHEVKLTCMSGGTLEIFLEPYPTQPRLVVIGHHAIVDALVSMAKALDYHVTVLGEDLTPERFPAADRVIGDLDFSQVAVTRNTYIVIASHGNYDELALEALLPKKPPYIALVASKKRTGTILEYLRQSGMAEETLAALKYPAGLNFGAETPAEIALSILAEMVQRRRQGLPGEIPQTEPVAVELLAEETIPVAVTGGREAVGANSAPAIAGATPVTGTVEAIDPICGMTVEIATARYTAVHEGVPYYFCSAHCKMEFEKNPGAYLKETQAPMSR